MEVEVRAAGPKAAARARTPIQRMAMGILKRSRKRVKPSTKRVHTSLEAEGMGVEEGSEEGEREVPFDCVRAC